MNHSLTPQPSVEHISIRCRLSKIFENLKHLIFNIYLSVYITRLIFFLLSQSIYLHYVIKLNRADLSNEKKQDYEKKIESLDWFMSTVGNVYRHLSGTGVVAIVVIFGAIFMFVGVPIIFKKYLTKHFKSGFFLFIHKTDDEHDRIQQNKYKLLMKIITSNVNYKRFVSEDIEEFRTNKQIELYLMQNLNQIYKEHIVTTALINNRNYPYTRLKLNNQMKSKEKEIFILKLDDFDVENNSDQLEKAENELEKYRDIDKILNDSRSLSLVEALNIQLAHLISLMENKESIWPPNRNLIWRERLKKRWFFMYATTNLSLLPTSELILCILHAFSYKSLKNFKEKNVNVNPESKDSKVFNYVDTIYMLEELLLGRFTVEGFLEPLALTIIGIQDQMKYLLVLKERFLRLERKLKEFNEFKKNLVESIELAEKEVGKKLYNSSQWINWKRIQNTLEQKNRLELDHEALELYISFQLFIEDARLTLSFAELVMNQRAYFVLIILVPTCYFLDSIETAHLKVLLATSFIILVGIDAAFAMVANLHSHCIKLIKRSWSIVANSTLTSENISIVIDDDESSGYVCSLFHHYSHQKHYLNSPINPHTILLWHKLIENNQFLAEQFVAKIFNSIKLDFNGILKINFWVVSLFLVSLTYLCHPAA